MCMVMGDVGHQHGPCEFMRRKETPFGRVPAAALHHASLWRDGRASPQRQRHQPRHSFEKTLGFCVVCVWRVDLQYDYSRKYSRSVVP